LFSRGKLDEKAHGRLLRHKRFSSFEIMRFRRGILLNLIVLLVAFGALTGCDPAPTNPDELKESHYLAGRNRVNAQDFKGAIEQFEKALEINPRNASAHFELGWLHEEHLKDYAAAIYHYERHLKLRPRSDYAERARERIRACKLDLAKTEVLGPVTKGLQQDLERLTTENILLKRQLEAAQAQLAARPVVSNVVIVPRPNPEAVFSGNAPAANTTPDQTPNRAVTPERQQRNQSSTPNNNTTASTPRPRVHIVKSGDTIATIARQYNVKLTALLGANPGINPARLQLGQKINIPSN
jgi:LysM repeat protein